VNDDFLPAERKVLEALGDLPLDFRAMAAVSNLFRASAAVRRHMERRVLATDRLSWTSFVVLWVLWVWGDLESRDLAAAVGISRPTSSGVVTTLERRGYVQRKRNTMDGRMVRVSRRSRRSSRDSTRRRSRSPNGSRPGTRSSSPGCCGRCSVR
jgi:DNA-binding MarR family transcriptional regulator